MVADVLELRVPGVVLRLRTDQRGWCQVELQTDSRIDALGADARHMIVERLRSGLAESLTGRSAGEIGGVPVRSIMSLAERHCSLYGGDVGPDRHVFFQGAG